jgi:hypothetical protein
MNLANLATLAYSSEDPDYPIENILNAGSPEWRAAVPGVTEELVIEFDEPQSFNRLVYEVRETEARRAQEIQIDASDDNCRSFRQLLVQEFTFSPDGATFQREDLHVLAEAITHLRLVIIPNKQGSGVASLMTLYLFQGS